MENIVGPQYAQDSRAWFTFNNSKKKAANWLPFGSESEQFDYRVKRRTSLSNAFK